MVVLLSFAALVMAGRSLHLAASALGIGSTGGNGVSPGRGKGEAGAICVVGSGYAVSPLASAVSSIMASWSRRNVEEIGSIKPFIALCVAAMTPSSGKD